jgi:hypothetical protein
MRAGWLTVLALLGGSAVAACGGKASEPAGPGGDDSGGGDDGGCASCGADAGSGSDGQATTGNIGVNGGTASRLHFAIVGDTRPPYPDDTASYPTPIITKIYDQMEAFSPRPLFGVSTGDYMYANPSGDMAGVQLDMYLGAKQHYSGLMFPTMGNHECTGSTDSNCGTGNQDGITNNYTTYISKMLGPLQKTQPYYEIDVDASDGSWTAKFLFVTGNAWTTDEGTWFDGAMARATTYTFVIRHESNSVNTAPGVNPTELTMGKFPLTLSIVGHSHTYDHQTGSREVLVGNGGAPMSGTKSYGFGLVSQRSDGVLDVDMIDYKSGMPVAGFHFAVKPDGSATQ